MNNKIILFALGCMVFCHSIAQDTRTIKINHEYESLSCDINIEYPLLSNEIINNTIVRRILQTFDFSEYEDLNITSKPEINVNDYESMNNYANSYSKKVFENLKKNYDGMKAIHYSSSLLSDEPKFVCYSYLCYTYVGGTDKIGNTVYEIIRKSDGKVMDTIINPTKIKNFEKLLYQKISLYNETLNCSSLWYSNGLSEEDERVPLPYTIKFSDSDHTMHESYWIDSRYLYIIYENYDVFHSHEILKVPLADAKPYLSDEILDLL